MPLPPILGALGRIGSMLGPSSTIGKLGDAAFRIQNLVGAAGQLNNALGKGAAFKLAGLGDAIAKLPATSIGAFSTALNTVQSPLLAVTGALGGFHNSVTAVGSSVSAFTKLANPALTQRFQFASDDLAASIGRGLIPVLTGATKFTRMFADVVYSVSGPLQRLGAAFDPLVNLFPRITGMLSPLVGAVGQFIDHTTKAIKPLVESAAELAATGLAPIIGAMTQNFIALTTVMKPQIELVSKLATVQLNALNTLSRFSGLSLFGSGGSMARTGAGGNITGRSIGAAVGNVSFGGVEGYEQKAWMQAFSLGTGAGGKPEERTAMNTDKTFNLLQTWSRYFEALPNLSAIAGFIQSLPKELADKLWQAIRQNLPNPSFGGVAGTAAVTSGKEASEWATRQGQRIQAEAEAARNAMVRGADTLGIPLPSFLRK